MNHLLSFTLTQKLDGLNPLNAKYYYPNDVFETVINDPTSITPYAFGHSDVMANAGYGYWQNILTCKYSGYHSQILIGSSGEIAVKYYTILDGQVYENTGWKRLAMESDLQWKNKTLLQTVDAAGTPKEINIPEIVGARECLFTVGDNRSTFTYRQCLLTTVGQSAGFEYNSPYNSNEYFFGHLHRTQSGVIFNISGISAVTISNVELIDVSYR